MRPVQQLGVDPMSVVLDDCDHIIAALGDHVERLAGRNVLITGAAGMLPAYLVDTIVRLNDTGRLASPATLTLVVRDPDANEGRLSHLRTRKDVRFIVADAGTPYHVHEPAQVLVHAASPASPAAYRADPDGTLRVNTAGTSHVLDLARRFRAESVLYLSTSEVYGNPPPDAIPTPETFVAPASQGSSSSYVAGKRAGESLCLAAFAEHRTPVKIARPFHFHGPGLRLSDGRIVAELIRQGLAGERLALKSDGLATRTYGYAADATIAFLRLLLSDENGEAFNVGAPGPETTMRELAGIIARLMGLQEPVRYAAESAANAGSLSPNRVRPDVSKIRERLGVVATVGLEEGLSRTIQWHRGRSGHAAGKA